MLARSWLPAFWRVLLSVIQTAPELLRCLSRHLHRRDIAPTRTANYGGIAWVAASGLGMARGMIVHGAKPEDHSQAPASRAAYQRRPSNEDHRGNRSAIGDSQCRMALLGV